MRGNRGRGMTLVELLFVIAVIGAITAVAVAEIRSVQVRNGGQPIGGQRVVPGVTG